MRGELACQNVIQHVKPMEERMSGQIGERDILGNLDGNVEKDK